jgi:hypothetical protein
MWRNHNQSKPDLWPRHDFCQCWFILFKGLVDHVRSFEVYQRLRTCKTSMCYCSNCLLGWCNLCWLLLQWWYDMICAVAIQIPAESQSFTQHNSVSGEVHCYVRQSDSQFGNVSVEPTTFLPQLTPLKKNTWTHFFLKKKAPFWILPVPLLLNLTNFKLSFLDLTVPLLWDLYLF